MTASSKPEPAPASARMRLPGQLFLAIALALLPLAGRAQVVTPPTLDSITPPASAVSYGGTVTMSGTWTTNLSSNNSFNSESTFSWFDMYVTAPDGTTSLSQAYYVPSGTPGVRNTATYGFTSGALNQVGNWTFYLETGDGRPWYTTSSTYTVTVSKISQTISFTNPGTKAYGTAPFALTATSTSGLGVSFSILSGPASVSGSTVTLTGPGVVVVAANQSGNTTYAAAAQVTQSFTVNDPPPVITFTTTSAANIAVGSSVTFTGTATDSNGILYGDQFYRYDGTTYYHPNGAVNTRTWTTMTADTGWSALSNSTDIPSSGSSDTRTAVWTSTTAGTYQFYYAAVDTAGTWSPTQNITINVVSPPTATVTFGANPLNFGQSTSVVMNITEGTPGTLATQQMLWDAGVGAQWTGIGFPDNYPSNTTGMTSVSDLTSNALGTNSSTKSLTFTPWAAKPGGYVFLSWGQNNVGANPVSVPTALVVNKATPNASFPAATKVPLSGTTYTVIASDLAASFTNPYSATVTAPSGAVTYTISPASPNGTVGSAVSAGTSLTAGLTYVIRASLAADSNYNAATVDSTWTISKAGQTISFPAVASQTYGNAPFSISASATSGLTVSFTILSGPGTLSGNTVTITGAGTIVIQASQAGNANWAAASNVQQSVVVSQAPQSITLTPSSANLLASQSATFTAAGGQNGYDWSGTAGASGNGTMQTLTFPTPGTYTVTVQSPAGGNYLASNAVTASVTVATAYTLTVIPDSGGTVTGGGLYAAGSNPAISATANTGYVFAGWYGANATSIANIYSPATTISLTGNLTVNARFTSISSVPILGTVNFGTATFASATSGTHTNIRDAIATNTGNSQLEVRSVTVVSNTSDYSATSNGGMLAAGGSLSTPVAFSPSGSTLGTRTGTLVIVSTDGTYPVAGFTLTGNAMDGTVPPTVTLSVTSLSLIFPNDSITLNMTASTSYDSIAYFTWYLSTPTGATATTTVMGPSLTLTSDVPYSVPNLTSSIGTYTLVVTAVDTNGLTTTGTLNFSVVQGLYNRVLNLRAEPTGNLNLWFTTSPTNQDTVPVWVPRS